MHSNSCVTKNCDAQKMRGGSAVFIGLSFIHYTVFNSISLPACKEYIIRGEVLMSIPYLTQPCFTELYIEFWFVALNMPDVH